MFPASFSLSPSSQIPPRAADAGAEVAIPPESPFHDEDDEDPEPLSVSGAGAGFPFPQPESESVSAGSTPGPGPGRAGLRSNRASLSSLPELDEEEGSAVPTPRLPQGNHSNPYSRTGSFRHIHALSTIDQPIQITSSAGSHSNTSSRRSSSGIMDAPSSPQSFVPRNKPSASPNRPHLNALSPLQTFSPLQPLHPPAHRSPAHGSITPDGGRSRASSMTKSLSRRQSLYAHAAKWEAGGDYEDENFTHPENLFSRLTLVKAPEENPGLKKRSKSSSALSPIATDNGGLFLGGRMSFTATPQPQFYSPLSNETTHRLSVHKNDLSNKVLTPQEINDLALGLLSPVAVPEGGFKGAELKRRKSAGSASRRTSVSQGGQSDPSPSQPPLALEPVEYALMDEDTLLPFVEREVEVKELLQHPANKKMVNTIKAAFPKTAAREHWQALDPDEWSWDELMRHLALTRAESPDYMWIFRARKAVRRRSVAMWEKFGVCLGCDDDLLNAGGEDGLPQSWGGLGLGEDGEYDPSASHVYIDPLEAVDPEEAARAARELDAAFGDIVEGDEGETIGEYEEDDHHERVGIRGQSRPTPAQRAGNSAMYDPMESPVSPFASLGHGRPTRPSVNNAYQAPGSYTSTGTGTGSSPSTSTSGFRPGHTARSKSFVGLQICTGQGQAISSPSGSYGSVSFARSPFPMTPLAGMNPNQPIKSEDDRGPDQPLFPSSFSTLGVQPILGRSASMAVPGIPGSMVGVGVTPTREAFGRSGFRRKQSGTGLSESAITFASESEYAHSVPDHD